MSTNSIQDVAGSESMQQQVSIPYKPLWNWSWSTSTQSTQPGRHSSPDLLLAGQLGLASGRLYVNGDLVRGASPPYVFESSGLCYESRYFLTTVHFKFKEEGLLSQLRMQTTDQDAAYVATTQEVRSNKRYGVRKVHLFHFNDELDLAIFRLNPGEKSWDRFAKCSQFQPAMDFIGSQAWAVGYAARYDDRYDNYVLNYPALLPGGYSDSWKHLIANQSFNFDDMFLSNKRALYVGDIEEVDLATSTGLHSIPAWFGLSGSMVGAIAYGQANIIGLVKSGDPDKLCNGMVAMTERSGQWIKDATDTFSATLIGQNIPSGQIMPTNRTFTMAWALKNTGTQALPDGCSLQRIWEDEGVPFSVERWKVNQDEGIIISVSMVTPEVAGTVGNDFFWLDPGRYPLASLTYAARLLVYQDAND
ncbi:hypothetical protein BDR22DRAFT_913887 [Usnea florida]